MPIGGDLVRVPKLKRVLFPDDGPGHGSACDAPRQKAGNGVEAGVVASFDTARGDQKKAMDHRH
jgi:hypothetical protein